jgi:hypothetical protein
VPDPDDVDQQHAVEDLVHDSVVADPDPVHESSPCIATQLAD